jgi:alkylhydroperoxidase/carboxymuconolactone decarboxylase family protein YurZ
MATPSKTRNDLVSRLRTAGPNVARLLVHTADEDKPMEVAIPDVRKKWSRVKEVLDDIAWTKVELLDKKGALIMVHARTALDEKPAGDMEDLIGSNAAGDASKIAALMQVAVTMVLRAQDGALGRQAEMMETVLSANMRLVDSTMRRFEQMDNQYQEMIRLNHAMHGKRFAEVEEMIRAAKEAMAGSDEESSGAIITALVPAMVKAITDKSDDKPKDSKPNGVPTKKAAPQVPQ